MDEGIMWECECGHVESGGEAPSECSECLKLDSFMKLPEEIVKDRDGSIEEGFDDEY